MEAIRTIKIIISSIFIYIFIFIKLIKSIDSSLYINLTENKTKIRKSGIKQKHN